MSFFWPYFGAHSCQTSTHTLFNIIQSFLSMAPDRFHTWPLLSSLLSLRSSLFSVPSSPFSLFSFLSCRVSRLSSIVSLPPFRNLRPCEDARTNTQEPRWWNLRQQLDTNTLGPRLSGFPRQQAQEQNLTPPPDQMARRSLRPL